MSGSHWPFYKGRGKGSLLLFQSVAGLYKEQTRKQAEGSLGLENPVLMSIVYFSSVNAMNELSYFC